MTSNGQLAAKMAITPLIFSSQVPEVYQANIKYLLRLILHLEIVEKLLGAGVTRINCNEPGFVDTV
jgi:hypothetical protein